MKLKVGPYGVIVLSFIAAFMLTALPLPEWARPWRPAWVAMVLLYWSIASPQQVGVMFGWITGLLLDVLNGAVLGQHALGLALLAYVAVIYHQRIRLFPMFRQAVVIGSIIFFYLVLMITIYGLLGTVPYGYLYLAGAVTSGLLWPWVFVILRDVRRTASAA